MDNLFKDHLVGLMTVSHTKCSSQLVCLLYAFLSHTHLSQTASKIHDCP